MITRESGLTVRNGFQQMIKVPKPTCTASPSTDTLATGLNTAPSGDTSPTPGSPPSSATNPPLLPTQAPDPTSNPAVPPVSSPTQVSDSSILPATPSVPLVEPPP